MTNGDMLRSLCDEQLAKLFDVVSLCDKRKCIELIKEWLKEEVSNEWIKTMIND